MIELLEHQQGARIGATVRRTIGVLGAAMLAWSVVGAASAPAALAHSALISSNPAADSVVVQPPTTIELVFNQDIKAFGPKVAITIAGQDPIEIVPTIDGPTVIADLTTVALPDAGIAGEPVSWRVGYRVVSADGHPITGLIDFSVGSGPAQTAGSDAASTAVATGSAAPGSALSGGAVAGSAGGGDGGVPTWWLIGGAGVLLVVVVVLVMVLRGPRQASPPH